MTTENPSPATREVPLTKGYVALVDADDYDRVVAVGSFRIMAAGGKWDTGPFYAVTGSQAPNHHYLHRLILNAPKGSHVDHINGDTLDNRKANLRLVTPKENAANRGVTRENRSGYKGVIWHGAVSKWRGQVQGPKALRSLWECHYDTAEDAAHARDAAVRRLKDPATERFNFPLPGERGLDGSLAA